MHSEGSPGPSEPEASRKERERIWWEEHGVRPDKDGLLPDDEKPLDLAELHGKSQVDQHPTLEQRLSPEQLEEMARLFEAGRKPKEGQGS
jgi:hypothetical protein